MTLADLPSLLMYWGISILLVLFTVAFFAGILIVWNYFFLFDKSLPSRRKKSRREGRDKDTTKH